MSKMYLQALSVIGGIILSYFITHSFLSNLSTYLLALLIVAYSLFYIIKKRSKLNSDLIYDQPISLFSVICIITLIIFLTNGLTSPFFFLTYFVIVLLALISRPILIIAFVTTMVLFFVPEILMKPNFEAIIKAGSLVLIAPLTYFLAKGYTQNNSARSAIDSSSDEIIQEAEALEEDGYAKTPEEAEAIKTIIEEAENIKNSS